LSYSFDNNSLSVYHQNIRSLSGKTNELISSLYPDLPHLLCLTEHHLNYSDIDHTYIDHYNLGAKFCRQTLKKGGVCIFVHKKLKFSSINLNRFCKEQDLEVCAVKLQTSPAIICILSIYRAPTGNFLYFLKGLDSILKSLYSNNMEFIICGDVNTTTIEKSSWTPYYSHITSTVRCTFQLEPKITKFLQLITFSLILAELEIIP
jgi:exonuclease III